MALIATTTMKSPFATITAGGLTYAYTAGNTGGDTFTVTGRELLLIYNSHASIAYTVTITSVVDDKGRTGDITAYSLAAGEFAYFTGGMLAGSLGWKNSQGVITMTPSNAAVKWAVLKLPDGVPG